MSAKSLAKAAVAVIIGLAVVGLLAAVLAPVALNAITADDAYTETQDVGETVEVTANLNSTLDSVNTTSDDATYTLTGPESSVTHTVANGSSQDYALDGGTVTVTVDDVNSNSATATYDVPTDFGWSGGASGLWNILDVVIVLALFLSVVGFAVAAIDRAM